MTRERRTQVRLHLLHRGHVGLGRVEEARRGSQVPPTTHALHSQWKMLESFQEARDREDHVTQGGTRGCLSGLGGADAT